MKILLGCDDFFLTFDRYQNANVISDIEPRLMLPYIAYEMKARGYRLSFINLSSNRKEKEQQNREPYYSADQILEAISNSDCVFLWGREGIRAIVSEILSFSIAKKVVLGSFIWGQLPTWKLKLYGAATRLAAKRAKAIVHQSKSLEKSVSQVSDAKFIHFRWGVDTQFYYKCSTEECIPNELRTDIKRLLSRPYVILQGDQQRMDKVLFEACAHNSLRLVRLPSDPERGKALKNLVSKMGLSDNIFVLDGVPYTLLRYLLQNASAYAGWVDSSWQPAGWTSACEALSCGLPLAMADGIVPEELINLGATPYLEVFKPEKSRDFVSYLESCTKIPKPKMKTREIMEFSRRQLDIECAAKSFVDQLDIVLFD